MNSFGSIWPKRSSTPCSPKSGEQDDQITPIEAAASISAMALGHIRHHCRDAVAFFQTHGAIGLLQAGHTMAESSSQLQL